MSRNVVLFAYEQLGLEGYLEGRVGSGTRVSSALPAHLLRPEEGGRGRSSGRSEGEGVPSVGMHSESRGRGRPPPRLSPAGERLAETRGLMVRRPGVPGPFLPGVVGAEDFPARVWSRITSRIWRTRSSEVLRYGDPQGYLPLREALADHVRRYRSVRCSADQVVITSGSQQALDLTARILVAEGEGVAVEDPGYRGVWAPFRAVGARLIPIPVDGEGVLLPDDADGYGGARVLCTTPSNQYPMGATLTVERRLRLLEWASEVEGWIVEDDYDSEFRYTSRPLPSLQGLDGAGRVIYVGTLSKMLAPGFRLGFLVLPEELVEVFRNAKQGTDSHSPLILQATLAEFMERGYLERHIARLGNVYRERRDRLMGALEAVLGGVGEVRAGEGGLHLTLLLPEGVDDRAISREAGRVGIEAPPLSDYAMGPIPRPGLVLGFAAVPVEVIADAVERLASAIAPFLRGGPSMSFSDSRRGRGHSASGGSG